MIIKITLNDNDFGFLMESFARKIILDPYYISEKTASLEEFHQFFLDCKRYRKCINLESGEYSEEDCRFVEDMVRKHFLQYISNNDSFDYLSEHFEITVVESITDQWKNGEVYYIFPTSYMDNVLNF